MCLALVFLYLNYCAGLTILVALATAEAFVTVDDGGFVFLDADSADRAFVNAHKAEHTASVYGIFRFHCYLLFFSIIPFTARKVNAQLLRVFALNSHLGLTSAEYDSIIMVAKAEFCRLGGLGS